MSSYEELYRIYGVVNNMLYSRGYERKDLEYSKFITETENKNLTIFSVSRTGDKDKEKDKESIFVFFPSDEKVGVKHIRGYRAEMLVKKSTRAIVVSKEGITPFAKNEIKLMSIETEPITIELFTESELLFDITLHYLVPKHEPLTLVEKEKLLTTMSIKEHQLQKMTINDPISRYYGLDKGSVVKISRPSETGGYSINYRIVV